MKTIKKSIFAALIVAIMGIFITKALSNTTANDLFDQNVEALALEDPRHPSSGEGDWEWPRPFPYCIKGATSNVDGVNLPTCKDNQTCERRKIDPMGINVNFCWEDV